MMTLLGSVLAILVSSVVFSVLAKTDPVRHKRSEALTFVSPSWRRLLLWLAWLPGIVLLFIGHHTSLLVWLGAMSIIGWVVALLPKEWF